MQPGVIGGIFLTLLAEALIALAAWAVRGAWRWIDDRCWHPPFDHEHPLDPDTGKPVVDIRSADWPDIEGAPRAWYPTLQYYIDMGPRLWIRSLSSNSLAELAA